jgi:hypothetical protein
MASELNIPGKGTKNISNGYVTSEVIYTKVLKNID